MTPLTTATTLATLQEMLEREGFDRDAPDLRVFWEVFKQFIALPVEDMNQEDTDVLFFESILNLDEPSKYHPGPQYVIGFLRQFTHEDEEGEYDGMEHLACSFCYEPHDDFKAVTRPSALSSSVRNGDEIWGGPVADAGEWIAAVEASPNFRAALTHTPRAVQIDQGPV